MEKGRERPIEENMGIPRKKADLVAVATDVVLSEDLENEHPIFSPVRMGSKRREVVRARM
jgi:hypothetical protein